MLNRKNKAFSILYLVIGLVILLPSKAYAQCTSPAADAGRIEYFSAGEQVFKYCNGTTWISWGDGGSGGIWSDSGSGYIEYTSTLGGVLIAPISGSPAPQGAVASSSSSSALDDLTDVDAASPTDGQCLSYNNSSGNWEASSSCGSGGGGVWSDSGSGYIEYTSTLGGVLIASEVGSPAPSGAVGNSGSTLDALSDVDAAAPSDGECLAYNNGSGNWEASSSCGSGGGGIWSDSGSGYIQYTSTLGGILVSGGTTSQAPAGAVGGGGGGASALNDLTDVDTTGVANGEVIFYSGGSWIAGTTSSAGSLWSNSGSGYIEYTSTLGGVLIGGISASAAPAGALGTSGGGGSGTPGGNDTELQFNDGGAFAGDANLVWDKTNDRLGIGDATPDVELDVVGDINYTGVIVDVSDIRMKYDIQPLDSPLKKLSNLHGFSFKMKGDTKETVEYGVSAQEVMESFPELVHEVDADGTLGVSYDGLIAPMIEAIKELKAENEMLKARLDALETKQDKQTGEQ